MGSNNINSINFNDGNSMSSIGGNSIGFNDYNNINFNIKVSAGDNLREKLVCLGI